MILDRDLFVAELQRRGEPGRAGAGAGAAAQQPVRGRGAAGGARLQISTEGSGYSSPSQATPLGYY